MIEHEELFAALAAPYDKSELKERSGGGGKKLTYVTARTVMNRLDNVLGPMNWWDEYSPNENSVLCRLTIRLPDGTTLTKQDAGGYAGMADSGDDDKSGYSDAFKRAAVKFGVSRYLYRDGVPQFVRDVVNRNKAERGQQRPRESRPQSADDRETEQARGRQAVNAHFKPQGPTEQEFIQAGIAMYKWAGTFMFEASAWWQEWLHKNGKTVPEKYLEIVTHELHVLNHLVKWAEDVFDNMKRPEGFSYETKEVVEFLRPLWYDPERRQQIVDEAWRWVKYVRPAQIREEVAKAEARAAAKASLDREPAPVAPMDDIDIPY